MERQGLFGIDQKQNGVVVVLGNLLEVGVIFSVLEHVGSFICRRRWSEANAKWNRAMRDMLICCVLYAQSWLAMVVLYCAPSAIV